EKILADAYLRLRQKFPDLFLIVVPRHHERSREVGRDLESLGVKFAFRSEVTSQTQRRNGELHCLVVNTTGELKYFYEKATVIFVGKSLFGEGGQNPIEPGALGKAMVFGPNMQNFEAIARAFVTAKGARQEPNAQAVEKAFEELLASPQQREELGRNALQVVNQNRGSIDRTIDMIL